MRTILVVLFVFVFTGGFIFGLEHLFLEDRPRITATAPPSGQDVALARELFRNIRRTTQGSTGTSPLQTDVSQINSAMRLGARFVPGFRGRVRLANNRLHGEVSIPLPWWRGQRWLNLSGALSPFEGLVVLQEVRVGTTNVPPALALGLVRRGANIAMGDRVGDTVLQAVTAMTIAGDEITFRLSLDTLGSNGLMRSAFRTLRGSEMPDPERIEAYHHAIRDAMASGALQPDGSFLPYLLFALNTAYENSTPETLPNAYTAAIFGLAKACGARDFAVLVGRLAFDAASFSETWPTSCDAVTFNGRIDSRRHFITSAALQAASNRGFSVSVGEFKELFDTISGGSGFDFTDMAANLSGIRLSNVMMETPRADWPALLALLETEHNVIVPFESIPQRMPDAEFKARFRDVDSPAYHQMIAEIERRIDTLRLYRAD